MGISAKDIRVFYDKKSKTYVIANDYKKRKLLNEGYGKKKAEKNSHGHLKSKDIALSVKENILSNKKEKSRNLWVLGCYIRITDKSYKYYDFICELYESKKNKSNQKYYCMFSKCIKEGVKDEKSNP